MEENKKSGFSRTALREQAFCLLFSYSLGKPDEAELSEYFDTAVRLNGYGDSPYLQSVFYGVVKEADELDNIIEKYSDGKGSITEVDDPVMFKKACTEIAQIASEKVELDISTITLEEFETDRLPFDVISALGFMIIDTKQIGGI